MSITPRSPEASRSNFVQAMKWKNAMRDYDPQLSTLLADPLIRTVMKADRVDPVALEVMMAGISRRLDPSLLQLNRASASCGC